MAQAKPARNLDMPEAEWRLRQELAACYQLFVRFGWTDIIFTHLAARVPDAESQYLINPYGLLFNEVTASNLLKVDFDGNVISGDFPCNHAGHAIHTAIFKNRLDINASLHSHTRAGMTVSTMKCGLLPITQQANLMLDNIAYHEYELSVATDEECARIGRDLGDKFLMVMCNHGLLGCGRTTAEAFYLLYTLESACKVQVDALASGQELHYTNERASRALADIGRVKKVPSEAADTAWQALLRSINQTD